MEALLKTKKVRAIGVSNFNIRRLESLLSTCSVVPATNQIEKHPYLQQPELADFCKKKGILLEAYSPLGNNQTGEPRTVDDAKVHEVGKRLGNFQDFEIPPEEMAELNALERHRRFNFPMRWGFDIFDEAGEEAVKKCAKDAGEENKTKFVV